MTAVACGDEASDYTCTGIDYDQCNVGNTVKCDCIERDIKSDITDSWNPPGDVVAAVLIGNIGTQVAGVYPNPAVLQDTTLVKDVPSAKCWPRSEASLILSKSG